MLSLISHHISCGIYMKTILNQDSEWGENLSPKKQHKLLITALKLIRSTNLTWKEFQQICINADEEIFSTCIKEVHEISSVDKLSELFKLFEELYSQKHVIKIVSRTSVLGLYLRKLVIAFKKMTFQETHKLLDVLREYININSYLDTTNKSFFEENSINLSAMEESFMEEKENVPFSPPLFRESINKELSKLDSEDSFSSENKVERFIREQVEHLAQNDRLAFNPSEMQECIQVIKRKYPSINDIHYLSFLNYLRVSESNNAVISLRQYFDYKTFDEKLKDTDMSDLERHQLKFKRFRYCVLNLGMMHCSQGNFKEAYISLEEAIRVAQETNDQQCLNQAMFWLNMVKQNLEKPSQNQCAYLKEQLEDHLNSEELPTKMIDIDYLSFLQLLKEDGVTGKELPSSIFYSLSQLSVTSLKTISNFAELTKSALLDFYGLINNALIYPQIVLINLTNEKSKAKLTLDEESLVLSLSQLSNFLRHHCLYKEGICIIEFCKSKLPVYSEYLRKLNYFKFQIEFEQSLNERNLEDALCKINYLKLTDNNEGVYFSTIMSILYLNFTEALKIIKEACNTNTITITLRIKLMLLKIEVLLLSTQPSIAIDEIIKVLAITKKHHMLGYTISAKLYLLHTQIILKLFTKAEKLVYEIIISTISYGSNIQQGVLFLLYARCLREKSKHLNNETNKGNLLDVLGLLDKSFSCFYQGNMLSHMKGVHYERALTYHELSYQRERNEASMQFRMLNENLKDIPNVMLI